VRLLANCYPPSRFVRAWCLVTAFGYVQLPLVVCSNNNNNKLTLQRRTINESYVTKAPVAMTKTEPNHWRGMFSENVWNTAGTQTGDEAQVADCSMTRDQTKKMCGHCVDMLMSSRVMYTLTFWSFVENSTLSHEYQHTDVCITNHLNHWWHRRGEMQQQVYQVHDVDELKQRSTDVWHRFEQRVINVWKYKILSIWFNSI